MSQGLTTIRGQNRRSARRRQRGFTLLELSIVVVIVGIVAAIAIPVFTNISEGSQDRSAHSSLRNVATSVTSDRDGGSETEGWIGGTDTPSLVAALAANEPNLAFTDGDSEDPTQVSVERLSDTQMMAAARADTGVCFVILIDLVGQMRFAEASDTDPVEAGDQCAAGDLDPGFIQGSDFDEANNAMEYTPLECNTSATITPEECAALVALYLATDGDNWTDNTGWMVDYNNPCTWAGVLCEAGNAHVEELNLGHNNLTGHIPAGIRGLVFATNIALNNNSGLGGPIPGEIGELGALEYFSVAGSSITGTLPPEFGQLINLEGAWLNHNDMSGEIPAAVMGVGEMNNGMFVQGNSGCLTAETPELEAWLAGFNANWNDGC